MMVGYAKQHAGDTYRMWDPNTKRVHVTRDVIWLNKMFFKEKSTIDFNPEATLEIFEKKRSVDENDEQEDPEKAKETEVDVDEEGELANDEWDEQQIEDEPRENE